MNAAIPDAAMPKLARGVRLKHDAVRGEWLLLAPERVVKLDAVAEAVLRRCDGARSLRALVDDLAAAYAADRGRIETDVRALLQKLLTMRVLEL